MDQTRQDMWQVIENFAFINSGGTEITALVIDGGEVHVRQSNDRPGFIRGEPLRQAVSDFGTAGMSRLEASIFRGTFFDDMSETKTYEVLIDVFRLKMSRQREIWYMRTTFADIENWDPGVEVLYCFRAFLIAVERVWPTILPAWWSRRKHLACETMASDEGQWHSARRWAQERGFKERYRDEMIEAMEAFGKAVYVESADMREAAGLEGVVEDVEDVEDVEFGFL